MQDMLIWWYYLLKAWATQSPRDALDISKDMIMGSGKWGESKNSTMSGATYASTPQIPLFPAPTARPTNTRRTQQDQELEEHELALAVAELRRRRQRRQHQQRRPLGGP
jgi:hypothetical protein